MGEAPIVPGATHSPRPRHFRSARSTRECRLTDADALRRVALDCRLSRLASAPSSPRLRGDHAADVVIVGGGLTGCATAHACAAGRAEAARARGRSHRQGRAGAPPGLLLPDPGPSSATSPRARPARGQLGLRIVAAGVAGRRGAAAAARRLRAASSHARPVVGAAGRRARSCCASTTRARRRAWPCRGSRRRQITPVTPLDVPAAMRSATPSRSIRIAPVLVSPRPPSARGATFFEHSAVKKVRFGPHATSNRRGRRHSSRRHGHRRHRQRHGGVQAAAPPFQAARSLSRDDRTDARRRCASSSATAA